jgi:CHAT domain-containing protein/predicted nucleic acid-binding protein
MRGTSKWLVMIAAFAALPASPGPSLAAGQPTAGGVDDAARHEQAARRLLREGEYQRAADAALAALSARERASGRDHPDTLAALELLASIYNRQGRTYELDPLLVRLVDTRQRLLGATDPATLRAKLELVESYQQQGRGQEALNLAFEVLAVQLKREGAEHPATTPTLRALGALLLEAGNAEQAVNVLQRAYLNLQKLHGDEHPDTQRALVTLGAAWLQSGQFELSGGAAVRLIEALAKEQTPNSDYLTQALSIRLLSLIGQRRAYDEFMPTARALAAAERTRRLRDMAYGAGEESAARTRSLGTRTYTLFLDAAWLAAMEKEAEPVATVRPEAFEALQQAMIGPANEAIVRRALGRLAARRSARLGEVAAELERLRRRWAALPEDISATFMLPDADGASERQRLETERAQIDLRLTKLAEEMRAAFPDYYDYLVADAVPVDKARQLLGADEAILLAMPTPFSTHVMALTKDGLAWQNVAAPERDISAAVQQLRWEVGASVDASAEQIATWERANPAGGMASFDRTLAHQLYQAVVAPVASVLKDKKRIYIVAGGTLGAIPFSLLVTEPPQGRDNDPEALRNTRWFGDEAALVHVPSVQALGLLRDAGPSGAPQGGLAGFGDPMLQGSAETRNRGGSQRAASSQSRGLRLRSGGAIADPRALRSLARLPGTARELEAIRQTFQAPPGAIRTGAAATEKAVRAADLTDARILVFATHGLTAAEMDVVAEPGLVLTPPAEATEQDDGFLAASEVATLKLDADWVILSACNTATGEEPGQGLGGLARSFFFAGARNLLASHWPVHDEVASEITVRTITLERQGVPRAEAFRQAMRAIRLNASHDTATETWAHPFYWAPFVLIGDGGS